MNSNPLKKRLEEYEREQILAALDANDGNISRAAEALGLKRSNLSKKIKKHQLHRKFTY